MKSFLCPLCKTPLLQNDHTLTCKNGHCFDLAKQGYVNLLIGLKQGQVPGDNKEMVDARRDFLALSHYEFMCNALSQRLSSLLKERALRHLTFLDCGCGEGYYTSRFYHALSEICPVSAYGIDISKRALAIAARRDPEISYAVASAFHLPMADHSVDLLFNLFSPYAGEEYLRVLKAGGIFAMVIPARRHLFSLKEVVYDNPYENEVKDFSLEGFSLLSHEHVENEFTLSSPKDIRNLFAMTPYYYKTPPALAARLLSLDTLTTSAEFEILIYEKKKEG